MNERETTKEAVDKNDDWAILPFDEDEDDKRWNLLIEETEKLEKDVAQFQEIHGEKLLMNENLPKVQAEELNKFLGELF